MKSEAEWADEVKRLLRTEMAKRGLSYDQLTQKLAEIGVKDTSVNIRNKVARGKFTSVFFLQCLRAIGCKSLTLDEIV